MSYFERLNAFIVQLCMSQELCKLFVMYVKREIGDYQFNGLVGRFAKYHKMDLNNSCFNNVDLDNFQKWCEKWNRDLAEEIAIAKTPWLDMKDEEQEN